MKTLAELRKLDKAALSKELEENTKKLFHIKFDVTNDQSKNSHLIGRHRKQNAKIKTVMKEKELEKAA